MVFWSFCWVPCGVQNPADYITCSLRVMKVMVFRRLVMRRLSTFWVLMDDESFGAPCQDNVKSQFCCTGFSSEDGSFWKAIFEAVLFCILLHIQFCWRHLCRCGCWIVSHDRLSSECSFWWVWSVLGLPLVV